MRSDDATPVSPMNRSELACHSASHTWVMLFSPANLALTIGRTQVTTIVTAARPTPAATASRPDASGTAS